MKISKNCLAGVDSRILFALGLSLLAAGCDFFEKPAHRKISDARAVAMVEAAQKQLPPRRAVQPQVLSEDVRRLAASQGAGCAFNPSVNGQGPVFLAGINRGQMKINGDLVVLSADSGSLEVTAGLRQQYDGKQISVQIARDAADTTNVARGVSWPAKLTIRDKYEPLLEEARAIFPRVSADLSSERKPPSEPSL